MVNSSPLLFHLSLSSLPGLYDLLPARLVRQVGRDVLATVLSSAARQIRRRGGLGRVTCSGDAGEGGEALVNISMTLADSTIGRSMLVVVEEEGRWRVDLAR